MSQEKTEKSVRYIISRMDNIPTVRGEGELEKLYLRAKRKTEPSSVASSNSDFLKSFLV